MVLLPEPIILINSSVSRPAPEALNGAHHSPTLHYLHPDYIVAMAMMELQSETRPWRLWRLLAIRSNLQDSHMYTANCAAIAKEISCTLFMDYSPAHGLTACRDAQLICFSIHTYVLAQ